MKIKPIKLKYSNFLKGRLFELFIESILKKAGFETDRSKLNIKQLTRYNTLKGRGGTYNPDVIGLFKMPIPFAYPLFLVGECKNYSLPLEMEEVRAFLGAYTDIQQYNHISFKKNQSRFSQLFKQERFSYLPVMFSIKGFKPHPQVFMYFHGINFISYETIPMALQLRQITENIITKINSQKGNQLIRDELDKLKSIEDLEKIKNIWKEEPTEEIISLKKLISDTSSRVGVLDNAFTIHILINGNKKDRLSKTRKKIKLEYNGNYFIIKKGKEELGFFSVPYQTLKQYLNRCADSALKELTIFKICNNLLFPEYYKISSGSRKKIIKLFNRPKKK